MWLHGDETGPAVEIGGAEGLGKLPDMHGRRADVTCFACPHHIIQGFHGFLDRRLIVPAVDLVQVDVIGSEAL